MVLQLSFPQSECNPLFGEWDGAYLVVQPRRIICLMCPHILNVSLRTFFSDFSLFHMPMARQLPILGYASYYSKQRILVIISSQHFICENKHHACLKNGRRPVLLCYAHAYRPVVKRESKSGKYKQKNKYPIFYS